MGVTSYKFDIFLSYASADNLAVAPAKGWVSQLYDQLVVDLPAFLWGDKANIFFDLATVGASVQEPELEAAARESAVFLAVASPSYAKRPYTNKEFNAFVEHAPWNGRLFVVERLAPDPRLTYPELLKSAIRRKFHEQTGDLGDAWMDPAHPAFRTEVRRLAKEIAERLLAIKAAGEAPSPRPATSGANRPCVLLAEACRDMEADAALVRRELQDIPVTVLPEAPYPETAEAFRKAFEADLSRASLFVQLLGPTRGWMPKGMPEGHVGYQAKTAMASGKEVLQWWPEHLKPDQINDGDHRALFDRNFVNPSGLESLKRCTLESFRAALVQRLTKPRQAEPFMRPDAPAEAPVARLFIHHDLNPHDRELALQIQQAVPEGMFEACDLPLLKWSEAGGEQIPAGYHPEYKDKMRTYTKLILVHGATDGRWVAGQINTYIKLRGDRPAKDSQNPVVEVIVTPPPKGPHNIHGQKKSWLKPVPVEAPLDPAKLQPVIDALR